MRKLFSIIAVVSFSALFIVACSKASKEDVQTEVSQDVLNSIAALGFSTSNVIAADGGYVVEGDIFLDPKDLAASRPTSPRLIIAQEEQYHTFNLVSTPRAITISVSGTVSAAFSTAVNNAIARYNAENLGLTFSRVASGGNINIRIVNTGQYIASAGFPSGGNPYNEIKYAKKYTTGFSDGFMTTVVAHELGHCIGFRHTDYMNRAYSCGSGGNEGQSTTGVGAVHIDGTPTGPDPDSWMLACLSASTNRPFNTNDKKALGYLY
ncbi:M57 family metalloprotease [Lacibacter sediminis]|uniref:Protease n=1 Tax=Lacibacter sediminis TaxID=2760713 RepID=A0A7G5XCM9_9BACT|nr:M57 family metalloprotease [Lacibacter sediminis]QNA43232.1 protease [Lacibacter sediminis]